VHRPAALTQPLRRHVRTKRYGVREAVRECGRGDGADALAVHAAREAAHQSGEGAGLSCPRCPRPALAPAARESAHWPDDDARFGRRRDARGLAEGRRSQCPRVRR
jgi:hypothetical protein